MSTVTTNPPPLVLPPTVQAERFKVVIAALAAVTAGVLLHYYAPATLHLPGCPFHLLTGLYCPGCGATRAVHHLLNFEFAEALRCNLMFVLASPFLATVFTLKGLRKLNLFRVPRLTISVRNTWVLAAVILAWGVVRNLPYPWFTIPAQ